MSDGYCDVDFSDASSELDPVEFFSITNPVARKGHECFECKETIPVGSRHQHAAYKFEGKFCSDRRCASCAEVAAEFGYFIFGGCLWSEMEEQWSNGANVQGCIARLTTVKARELMRRRWLRWKGLG